MEEKTIFERIIDREIPADIVYEDEQALAFLDINPVNIGHTLVIPKNPHRNIYEASDEDIAHVITIVKKLSAVIKEVVDADGINIHVNNDPAAGQVVFHLHFHIIPRFDGDGFEHWHGNISETPEDRKNLVQKISKILN